NGAACTADNQCGSNACVDGVCCETACSGRCRTCNNPTGTCMMAKDGDDPRDDCAGEGPCGGVCNGSGSCRFTPQGGRCREAGCQSDGYIATAGSCDGAGHCMFGITNDCNGFVCFKDTASGMDMCRTDCASDPQCVSKNYCNQNQCPIDLDNGSACTRDTQC